MTLPIVLCLALVGIVALPYALAILEQLIPLVFWVLVCAWLLHAVGCL